MAKKSRYERADTPDPDEPDVDVGQDSAAKAPTAEQLESAGSDSYQVVEPGTIIDGIYYPRADVPERLNMTALIDSSQAQALADSGVKLTKGGELVEATPKEPEPEEEPKSA